MRILKGVHKSLFFRCLKRQKIQAIYFKIQGTYFKISALYFLRQAMCFFARAEMCVRKREIWQMWRHIAVIVFGPMLRF